MNLKKTPQINLCGVNVCEMSLLAFLIMRRSEQSIVWIKIWAVQSEMNRRIGRTIRELRRIWDSWPCHWQPFLTIIFSVYISLLIVSQIRKAFSITTRCGKGSGFFQHCHLIRASPLSLLEPILGLIIF